MGARGSQALGSSSGSGLKTLWGLGCVRSVVAVPWLKAVPSGPPPSHPGSRANSQALPSASLLSGSDTRPFPHKQRMGAEWASWGLFPALWSFYNSGTGLLGSCQLCRSAVTWVPFGAGAGWQSPTPRGSAQGRSAGRCPMHLPPDLPPCWVPLCVQQSLSHKAGS